MALTTGIEHLTPSSSKGSLFQGNYITDFDFTKQFLPDVYERVELDKGEFAQQW